MSRDLFAVRARELAVAAGLDPDARVERPGAKPMPAWCTFRDAARAEHVAQEAAKREPAPQAPAYRDSPLRVFGEHEEGTLAQMRNCMAVGNVVAGVICADGHLGYAQPVGGVIAYEGQISISRRRLRHRLRQHGGAARHAVRGDRRTASARSSATSRR